MPSTTEQPPMTYRFLGDSGLLVSKLALGSWMHFDASFTVDAWFSLMRTAFSLGINFFDTAESYGSGQAEELLGGAIRQGISTGVWSREDLVISTKLFFGSKLAGAGPNAQGLSRKHIVEGMRASLTRLQLDYVDVVFCHRNEPFTPVEEVVRAMNFVIDQGWAFYWGTSEWSAAEIDEACAVADRLRLIRPIVEQPQYNLLTRSKVEVEFADLYKRRKLGLTVWSPLAMGILTGKYSGGDIPTDTRLADAGYFSAVSKFDASVAIARQLEPIAKRLNCSLAQLAIAWCVSNENVSAVLLGARNAAQLSETAGALRVVSEVTEEVKKEIDAIVQFVPAAAPAAAPVDPLRLVRSVHLDGAKVPSVLDAWNETVKRDDGKK